MDTIAYNVHKEQIIISTQRNVKIAHQDLHIINSKKNVNVPHKILTFITITASIVKLHIFGIHRQIPVNHAL